MISATVTVAILVGEFGTKFGKSSANLGLVQGVEAVGGEGVGGRRVVNEVQLNVDGRRVLNLLVAPWRLSKPIFIEILSICRRTRASRRRTMAVVVLVLGEAVRAKGILDNVLVRPTLRQEIGERSITRVRCTFIATEGKGERERERG